MTELSLEIVPTLPTKARTVHMARYKACVESIDSGKCEQSSTFPYVNIINSIIQGKPLLWKYKTHNITEKSLKH